MKKEEMKGLTNQILDEKYHIDTDNFTKDELLDIAKKLLFIADYPDYEKGYDIMSEYFDSIADELKEEVDKQLKECGL